MIERLLHPIRQLKAWLERFAEKPYAAVVLFACGFVEASLFPLSPDVLLIALGVTNPRKSVVYSLVVVAGSSLGAILGYYVGLVFYDAAGRHIIEFFGFQSQFQYLLRQYQLNAWLTLLVAGFTMIPFMIFSLAAGFNATLNPGILFAGALLGRLIRFVPIGVLLLMFGPRVKYYFDHYLGRTVLVIGAIMVGLLILGKTFF